jgi:peptidyl-prolyl cis-trans isomerase C
MAAPFAQAAAALKTPGELSPITKTEFGYHILQLVERKPDSQRSFEDVSGSIVEKLRKDYITRQIADHVSVLQNKPLDANPDLVASLRTRFLPAGVVLPEDAAQAAAEDAAKKKAADKDAGTKP